MPSTITVPYKGKFVTFELTTFFLYAGFGNALRVNYTCTELKTGVSIQASNITHSMIYAACYAKVN